MSDNVTAGMYALKPAWHFKGNVVSEYPKTWDAALKAADINWVGESRRAGYWREDEQRWVEIPDWQAIVREDTHMVLGCQPETYQFINNKQLGEVVETLLEAAPGGYQYECLFELLHGKKIVVTLKLTHPLTLGTDSSAFYQYVIIWARHDGQGGIKAIPAFNRVECQNMLTAAETSADRADISITIRHTANWQTRMKDAKAVFALALAEGEVFSQLAVDMGNQYVSNDQKDWFKRNWFPEPEVHNRTPIRMNNLDQARGEWEKIYNSKTCASIQGSSWGLAQATVEYLDHVRRARTDDTRINRQISPSQEKRRVLSLARQAATV